MYLRQTSCVTHVVHITHAVHKTSIYHIARITCVTCHVLMQGLRKSHDRSRILVDVMCTRGPLIYLGWIVPQLIPNVTRHVTYTISEHCCTTKCATYALLPRMLYVTWYRMCDLGYTDVCGKARGNKKQIR